MLSPTHHTQAALAHAFPEDHARHLETFSKAGMTDQALAGAVFHALESGSQVDITHMFPGSTKPQREKFIDHFRSRIGINSMSDHTFDPAVRATIHRNVRFSPVEDRVEERLTRMPPLPSYAETHGRIVIQRPGRHVNNDDDDDDDTSTCSSHSSDEEEDDF